MQLSESTLSTLAAKADLIYFLFKVCLIYKSKQVSNMYAQTVFVVCQKAFWPTARISRLKLWLALVCLFLIQSSWEFQFNVSILEFALVKTLCLKSLFQRDDCFASSRTYLKRSDHELSIVKRQFLEAISIKPIKMLYIISQIVNLINGQIKKRNFTHSYLLHDLDSRFLSKKNSRLRSLESTKRFWSVHFRSTAF